MFTLYDRPYDPLGDTSQLGNGIETLRSLVGGTETKLIEVGAVARHRRTGRPADAGDAAADPGCGRQPPLGAAGGRGARRCLGCSAGCSALSSSPTRRSPPRFPPVWSSTRSTRFGRTSTTGACSPPRSSTTRIASTPTNRLLTGLRGKDVLLVFVEAYGQQAVQGSSFSPEVDAALAEGNKRLASAGFSVSQRVPQRRRPTAASAGSRTPACRRDSGSTTRTATTS